MKWTEEEQIIKFNFFSPIAVLMVLAVLLFTVFFSFERRYHLKEIQNIEEGFLSKEKEWLQISVNEQIAHLKTRKKLVERQLRKALKIRVGNASRISRHLYELGISHGLEREEIAARIIEAIRPLRFNQGMGYFFINSMDGVPLLYPPDPGMEGSNIQESRATHQLKAHQLMHDTITKSGWGYVEYQWPKPGPDKKTLYKKISFVTYFEPLDMYIGCGEYVVDFDGYIKGNILEIMNKPGWNANPGNYLFILELHDSNEGERSATMVANANRPDLIGTILPASYQDLDGKEFLKKYMQGIRDNGDSFLTYRLENPEPDSTKRKICYVKFLQEWNWIIGQGMYLDDIEKLIRTETETQNKVAQKESLFFLFFFSLALCSSLLLSLFFSKRLKIIFKDYRRNKEKLQQELQKQRDSLEDQVEQRTLELKETTHQLIHSEKLSAIGRLSSSIAHEFNNPLNGIQSVLEGVQGSNRLEQEDVHMVAMALTECDRVRRLIRNLLDFNAPSAATQERLNIHEALDAILSMCNKELSSCSIHVYTEYGDDLPGIQAIPDQIKQVLLNLITNAKDAMQENGGVLTIVTEQMDQQVVVHINDTGAGIEPKDLDHIFEPFFTTKSAVKGTGLGLSVSYNIIKGHKGNIKVESVPGKGSSFTLYLPCAGD